MTGVTELGYLGIGVKDAAAWKDFAAKVVGMEVLEEGEGDRFYLRVDSWHHRLVVHANGSDDLEYLGWRVSGPAELDEIAKRLEAKKIPYAVGTEEDASERRVLGLLKLNDPGGNPTEIFYGPQIETTLPFWSGRRMHGRFVTGQGGLGHVIVRQHDPEAAYAFYSTILGMKGGIEYKLALPNGVVAKPIFMHCNGRDHSIAFGFGPMEKRINHLMIEVDTLDDVGMTREIVKKREIPIAIDLGKHSNDQAYTFYFANPSAWLWEVGWSVRKATEQAEYYTSDIFGHHVKRTGYGLDVELTRVEG